MDMRDSSGPAQGSVNLTIVGGRPSEDQSSPHGIPRGLEVLLKKAFVDEEFRASLLENRSRAGKTIGLELNPAESAMLDHLPREQLEAIIRATRVAPEDRRVFLGRVASVMLAALGAGIAGCRERGQVPPTKGIQPDRVEAEPADTPVPAQAGGPDPNRATATAPYKLDADGRFIEPPATHGIVWDLNSPLRQQHKRMIWLGNRPDIDNSGIPMQKLSP